MKDFFITIWDFLNTQFVSTLMSTIFGGLIVLYFTERMRRGTLSVEIQFDPLGRMPIPAYGHYSLTLNFYNSSQDNKAVKSPTLLVVTDSRTVKHGLKNDDLLLAHITITPKVVKPYRLNIPWNYRKDEKIISITFEYKDEKNRTRQIKLYPSVD